MRKMLRFEMYRRSVAVEVLADFPMRLLYGTHGRRVGEVVP